MLDRWHQTWHRDKKDLGTKFLNLTTIVGNVFLFFVLFSILGLVNHNKICVPKSLLLNPSNVSIPGCNYSQVLTTAFSGEISAQNASQNHHEEETSQFFLLNMVVLCIVSPLGFASIIISLSEYWMPVVQQLRWVIKARRKINLEVDGILAAVAVLSTLVFAIFSLPVAINATSLNHTMPCRTELIMNIISTIILTLIGIPTLFLFVQNIGSLFKGNSATQKIIEDEVQQAFENKEDMKTKLIVQLVTSIGAFILLLTFMPVRFSETSAIVNWDKTKEDCYRNPFLQPATIVLHTTDVITFLLTMILTVFYTIRLVLYCNLEKEDKGKKVEMINLI